MPTTESNYSLRRGDTVVNANTGREYQITGTHRGTVWMRRIDDRGERHGAYVGFNPSKHTRRV